MHLLQFLVAAATFCLIEGLTEPVGCPRTEYVSCPRFNRRPSQPDHCHPNTTNSCQRGYVCCPTRSDGNGCCFRIPQPANATSTTTRRPTRWSNPTANARGCPHHSNVSCPSWFIYPHANHCTVNATNSCSQGRECCPSAENSMTGCCVQVNGSTVNPTRSTPRGRITPRTTRPTSTTTERDIDEDGDETDGPFDEDETDGPIDEDETDGPFDEDETDNPIDEDETDGPIDEDETDGPFDEDETDGPTDEDETDGPFDEDETDGPTDEDETDGPIDEDETNEPTDEDETNEPTEEPTDDDETEEPTDEDETTEPEEETTEPDEETTEPDEDTTEPTE